MREAESREGGRGAEGGGLGAGPLGQRRSIQASDERSVPWRQRARSYTAGTYTHVLAPHAEGLFVSLFEGAGGYVLRAHNKTSKKRRCP